MLINFAGGVSLSYFTGILAYIKILQYGTDGFTSPLKEVMLRILLPLKIHRLQPGVNPRTLGSVVTIGTSVLFIYSWGFQDSHSYCKQFLFPWTTMLN
jgi:hypothetical protein